MLNEDAIPIIFFVVSLYAFAIVLLYVLARAWERALSTRRRIDGGLGPPFAPSHRARVQGRSADGRGRN
jgi:hypothetical protein